MKRDFAPYKKSLDESGFAIIENVFNDSEIGIITEVIESNTDFFSNTKQSKDLFAIRKIFSTLPGIRKHILNNNIKLIIQHLFGEDYFIVKGLYFDKPSMSNWFVAYHQDLSVSVSNKSDSPVFKGWTIKDKQFGVQPPLEILEKIYTIRIHLDDCSAQNGALHVIPGSHKKGILKSEAIEFSKEEIICEVPKGGVMLMRPLLLHASHKSTAAANRRVLHIEFCNAELPDDIHWAEKESIN